MTNAERDMTRVQFEVAECEHTGSYGLRHRGGLDVAEYESEVAFIGDLVAHDIVEHCHGIENIGSVADEIEALGAVWFTRVETGHYTGMLPATKWLSYDVGRMLELSWFGDERLCEAGRTSTGDDTVDAELRQVAVAGARVWLAELAYSDGDGPTWAMVLWHVRQTWAGLKAGYKAAQERWGDGYRALRLYEAISEAAKPVIDEYANADYEGLPVVLEYSEADGTATCSIDEDWIYG